MVSLIVNNFFQALLNNTLNNSILKSNYRDLKDGSLLKTLKGHINVIYALISFSSQSLLASGSQDNTIKIWNTTSLTLLFTLKNHKSGIQSLVQLNESVLASASYDTTIRLWNISDGSLLAVLEGHSKFLKKIDI